MRIAVIHGSADWSISDVGRGYSNAFKSLGHDVRDFPFNRWITFFGDRMSAWNQRNNLKVDDDQVTTAVLQLASEKALIDAVRHQAQVAVVISGMAFHPDCFELLHRVGVPVVLICTESPYNDEQQQYLAQFCDLVTVNDYASLDNITHPNLHYLPAAYDPTIHRSVDVNVEFASDVFFVGTGFAERKKLLEAVDWTGIDLRLFGTWPTVNSTSPLHRYLTAATMDNDHAVLWYNSTKVGINIHRTDGVGKSANPRVFELAACGTHQIVDSDRQEVFEILGDSVCSFYGATDIEDRIRECLADEQHRKSAAQRAQERVYGNTFEDRVKKLLQWL